MENRKCSNFDFARKNAFIPIQKEKQKQFLSLRSEKPSRCLVLFRSEEYITFHGEIKLTVLKGELECFGYIIKTKEEVTLSAPYNHHTLTIKTTNSAISEENEIPFTPDVTPLLSNIDTKECSAIFLIESVDWNIKSENELSIYFPPRNLVEKLKGTKNMYGEDLCDENEKNMVIEENFNHNIDPNNTNIINNNDEIIIEIENNIILVDENTIISEEIKIQFSENSSTLCTNKQKNKNNDDDNDDDNDNDNDNDDNIIEDNLEEQEKNIEKKRNREIEGKTEKSQLEFFNPFGIPGLHVITEPINYQIGEPEKKFLNLSNFISSIKNKRIMTVGVKGSGKSTTNRYLVNRLLNDHPFVIYLDTDLGQPEFTMPGVVSLSKIESPLFGPSFAHMRTPILSFSLGVSSPISHGVQYVDAIKRLTQYAKEHYEGAPIVLNTMGWVKQYGLIILKETIDIFKPNQIIQISQKNEGHANKPKKLKDENWVTEWSELSNHITKFFSSSSFEGKGIFVNCSSMQLSSVLEQKEYLGENCIFYHHESQDLFHLPLIPTDPKFDRMLRIASYFMVTPSKLLGQGITYKIPWKNLRLSFPNNIVSPSQSLYALNCTIVGLLNDQSEYELHCVQKDGEDVSSNYPMFNLSLKSNELPFIGYGIVKSIDTKEKTFTIITPIPFRDLKDVNTIVSTSIELPPSFLLRGISTNSPYLQNDSETYRI